MDEIRRADDVIRSTDNTQSWNYSNYHIAILGTPSTTAPWMLQISGHHLTHNITYNGPYVSATPMFIGTEPPDWYTIGTDGSSTQKAVVVGKVSGSTKYLVSTPNNATSSTTTQTTDPGVSSGAHHAPLDAQRAACDNLSTALQADATNYASAKLSGTFTDVVLGVTNAGDGNFPFKGSVTYPTSGRGVLYTSLSTAEKALVKAYIEAWVKLQATDVSTSLLADYESEAALAQTYVGVGLGVNGTPDFTANINNAETTPLNSQHSYIRVDGPRVWIEFVVQEAVAYKSQGWVHYHSLWRDKLADYGNEFGGYLDTTSTSTTYTRPTITSQPSSAAINTGGSTTLTVAATGTATLSYQWYKDSTAISGATTSSYAANAAGSYYVVITNLYGVTTSATATVTVNNTNSTPTISPTTLPTGVPGTAYSQTLAVSGGTAPYSWTITSGTLPDGLSLSTAGVLSGTPTAEGSSSFTVQATDSTSQSDTQALTLTIAYPALAVSSSSFTGTVSTAFSATLSATGGNGTYAWSLSSGTLPAGLSLSTAGVLSGTPTAQGTSTFTVQVADTASHTATGSITVTIAAASTGGGGTGGPGGGTGGPGGPVVTLPTAAVGIFTGTIARESTVNGNVGGRIVLSTTAAGRFTVSLLQGTTARAATGKVTYTEGSNPTIAAVVTWPTLGKLTLALTIDTTTGALSGTLASTSGSAAIEGWHYAWNASTAPATTRAGYYTVALDLANASDEGQTSIPQGVGFARVMVAKTGMVRVVGQTADARAFVTASRMGPNGEILVYQALYGGKGSLVGKLVLTPGAALADNSIAGTLTWNRPATTARIYAAGFGPVSLAVQGKYMAASASGPLVAGLPTAGATATLAFTEGGVSASASDPDTTFTYSSSYVVSLGATNPGKDTLVISKTNGLFNGTFTLLDGTLTRKVAFRGALVRLSSGNVIGAGYFLLPQIPANGQTSSTSPCLSGQVVIEQTQ